MRLGWGTELPTFRPLWTSIYIPEATTEQWERFHEVQRISTSPENVARLLEVWDRIGAVLLSQTIAKLLYGVAPLDGLTLASVTRLLAVVAIAAVRLPARKAAKSDRWNRYGRRSIGARWRESGSQHGCGRGGPLLEGSRGPVPCERQEARKSSSNWLRPAVPDRYV